MLHIMDICFPRDLTYADERGKRGKCGFRKKIGTLCVMDGDVGHALHCVADVFHLPTSRREYK